MDQITKSGTTITFGPYKDVDSLLHTQPLLWKGTRARVHYQYNTPIVSVIESHRQAKVSHWRNAVQIEDDLWLKNDGALLKGHFSRLEHQMNRMIKRENTHVLSSVTLHLPPGADGTYFVDESGNVSTSHFRPSPPSPSHIGTPAHLLSETRASLLEIRPRYPLLGGWNYTCTVGFRVRLTDGWRKIVAPHRYAIQVPFLTSLKGVAVDQASLRILLPEGSKDIHVTTPFVPDSQTRGVSWSFLDTTGKPVVELHKRQCAERHGALVTVQYTLSPLDHYRKVFVSALLLLLGVATLQMGSKLDLSIRA